MAERKVGEIYRQSGENSLPQSGMQRLVWELGS